MSKHRTLIPGVKHLTKNGTCLCECRECANPFDDGARCICPDCTGPCCVNNPSSDQDHHDINPCYDQNCKLLHPYGGPFPHPCDSQELN